jgi:hypothetical protein
VFFPLPMVPVNTQAIPFVGSPNVPVNKTPENPLKLLTLIDRLPAPKLPTVHGGKAQIPVPKVPPINAPVVSESVPVTDCASMPTTVDAVDPPVPFMVRPAAPPTAMPPELLMQTNPGKQVFEAAPIAFAEFAQVAMGSSRRQSTPRNATRFAID